MHPFAKTAPDAVTKILRSDCATSECKILACKCRKNFTPWSYYCSDNNSNCENPYKIDEDDSDSDGESKKENF